ncbi:MAG: hypothetical protein HYU64_21145 [Armatimonadetes bacterium]|nr:hypothetical protein [Armatimonadota bacterium]
MDKHYGTIAYLILFVFLLALLATQPIEAQLVLVDMKVKIVKVDRGKDRLEVRVHEGGNKNVQYVEIDGSTKFSARNREVSRARAWSLLRRGMIIRVKGGFKFDLKIRAKYIYW